MNTYSFKMLASFDASGANSPYGGLIADAAGNLYGTTSTGGPGGWGTVFALPRTSTGYGPVETLASFDRATNGSTPYGGLVADAAGNLYGTTQFGGAANKGTVFEIPKTVSGYGTLVTLASFDGMHGRTRPAPWSWMRRETSTAQRHRAARPHRGAHPVPARSSRSRRPLRATARSTPSCPSAAAPEPTHAAA